jgi:hypothetical protein
MDTLNSLLEKVNHATKNSPIFFATNDAERALGLEKVLNHYHILCIDDNNIIDYLLEKQVKVFCLEKELGKTNAIFRNSNRLLRHKLTKEYIKGFAPKNGFFMFFKIAPNLEKTARKMNFKVLNTSSDLNREFELKMPQYRFLRKLDIYLPKTEILVLKEANYKELVDKLGKDFIIQFNRGHTGGGTLEIDSKDQLEELKAIFPHRVVRISQKIIGPAYTLNACITKHGVAWGGLSYQITGVEECTSKKLATVGNDWSYPKILDKNIKKKIGRFTSTIGKCMKKRGFKGMFGLDLVIEERTNKPHIIEINARQPASIPMFTKLQLSKNQIPLNLLAIAEFMKIKYEIDVSKYNEEASAPFEAAQLFIRNKFSNPAKVVGGLKPGSYRLVGDNSAYNWESGKPELKKNVLTLEEAKDKPLVMQAENYALGENNLGLLILCTKEGKVVNENAEVARIQAKQTLMNKEGKLKMWLQEIVNGINSYIILKEIEND